MANYLCMTSPSPPNSNFGQTRSLVCTRSNSQTKVRENFLVKLTVLTLCNGLEPFELALALNSCPLGGPSPYQTQMCEA